MWKNFTRVWKGKKLNHQISPDGIWPCWWLEPDGLEHYATGVAGLSTHSEKSQASNSDSAPPLGLYIEPSVSSRPSQSWTGPFQQTLCAVAVFVRPGPSRSGFFNQSKLRIENSSTLYPSRILRAQWTTLPEQYQNNFLRGCNQDKVNNLITLSKLEQVDLK